MINNNAWINTLPNTIINAEHDIVTVVNNDTITK